jgi:hypothetical protein
VGDTTVKPLYGHQEGAVVGYNPHKPGRPSHAYHTFQICGVRLVLDVAVRPGNQYSSKHSEPHLWGLLDALPRARWPRLVRGDKDWGNERNMARCEQEGMPYLFKLRLTSGVKHGIEKLMGRGGWVDAGQDWQGHEAQLRLQGWGRSRRVVMLRRRVPETLVVTVSRTDGQGDLFWTGARPGAEIWEFAVLVTSLELEICSLAQLYRDRGDSENPFDELQIRPSSRSRPPPRSADHSFLTAERGRAADPACRPDAIAGDLEPWPARACEGRPPKYCRVLR